MERYESIFVAQPRMSEEEFDSLRQTYEQLIQTNGGSLTQSENWGKRRLAYRVHKHEEGPTKR
jgi:small subunit ribosomal protein S6